MKPFTVAEDELAGFDLGGWKNIKTNKIVLSSSGRIIDKWPDEITFFGNTFTLELVQQGGESKTNNTIWENASYG